MSDEDWDYDNYSDSSGEYDSEDSDESESDDDDESSSSSSSTDDEEDDGESEDDWSMEEEERVVMAAKEWAKFQPVQSLLRSVNDYMAIYSELKDAGKLVVTGSEGIPKPKHALPIEYAGEHMATWAALDKEEQYNIMQEKAKETSVAMEQLGTVISEKYGVEFKPGPLKGETRIKQKRDNDYEGDVRRVIDFVRCSFIVDMEHMDVAKQIVEQFQPGGGSIAEEWALVRVKDGFEKAENFMVGGYRDIKVNARYKPTVCLINVCLCHVL
jgi:hypothetical protein